MFEEQVKKLNGAQPKKGSYSVPEVMRMIGVGRQTVYKLIARGCFRSIKVEGSHRILKKSFDEWLEGKVSE